MISANELSKIFYTHDPLHTSCTVNENMEDEYDSEALDVLQLIHEGHTFETAIHFIFDYMFWKGCLIDNPATLLIISDFYQFKKENP